MKSLKILICSLLVYLVTGQTICKSQSIAAQIGIYDFTGNTASEFYILAPTVMVGYDVWKRSHLYMHISPGLSFNLVRYNQHYHYLYMIPLLATMYYDLPNPGAKVFPSAGMGISLLAKADHNKDFNKTHHSLAYGFHATGKLNIPLKWHKILTFDMTYNLLVPPVMEDINMSGVMLMIGLRIPIKQPARQ